MTFKLHVCSLQIIHFIVFKAQILYSGKITKDQKIRVKIVIAVQRVMGVNVNHTNIYI